MASGSTTARKEVSEWLKRQSDGSEEMGRMEIDRVKEEERRIVLKAAGGEAFSITYQTDYPNSADEYLFVETDSKVGDFVAAINDLRDFIYSQPPSLRLGALLDQLKRHLVKKSAKKGKGAAESADFGGGRSGSQGDNADDGDGSCVEGNESDGEFGDDEDGNQSDYVYEDDEDEDDAGGARRGAEGQQAGSTWLDEHYKKRNWQDKERILRAEMAANKALQAKEDGKGDKGANPSSKKVENIFTSRASSGVLTQDLLGIQRLEQELGMEVEAVDDNIFHWKVKITRTSESSPLSEDLRQLRSKFAYGYVEMELTFTMDLELNDMIVHPEGSYTELEHLLMRLGLVAEMRAHNSEEYDESALWEVVGKETEAQDKARRQWSQEKVAELSNSVERKRKRSVAAAAAASGNAMNGSSPTRDNDAEIDMEDDISTPGHAGTGTGTETGTGTSDSMAADNTVVPGYKGEVLDNPVDPNIPNCAGSAASSSSSIERGTGAMKKTSRQYWAAGTGYGHSGVAGEKWDVEAYLAAQREQDRLKEDLVQEIAYVMRPDERHTYPESSIYCCMNNSSHGNGQENGVDGSFSDDGMTHPMSAKGKGKSIHPTPTPTPLGESEGGDTGKTSSAAESRVDAGVGGAGGVAASTASAGSTAAAAAAPDPGGSKEEHAFIAGTSRRRKRLTLCQEEYRVTSVNSSLRILEESCLVPFLQQLLENDSLLDVDRHASLYREVFQLVRCITAWRSLRPLLCPMKGQARGKSLYRLLSRLGDRAKVYRSTTSKGAGGKTKAPGTQAADSPQGKGHDRRSMWRQARKARGEKSSSRQEQSSLTDLLLEVVQEVEDVVDASFVEELERASITRPMDAQGSGVMSMSVGGVVTRSRGSRGRDGIGARGRGAAREDKQGEEEEEEAGRYIETEEDCARYRRCMRPLQYGELDDLVGFSYKGESEVIAFRSNPQRTKRLGQEHADLSQSLPLSLSSSVFVRTHEDQMDWMQVMISGPDDTPYSGGLFAFDIFFPPNYPSSPPKVRLMTTGGGQHRFNPNLYAEGKVCLSLLGTWDGDRGESWNASTSTLLQVLVSIQSLILVPEPWFNEPGFERQLGTEQGREQSWEYNAKQREATIRLAMLDMIQRPPSGFEEVVKAHFFLRRKFLQHMLDRYVLEAKQKPGARGKDGNNHGGRIQMLAHQLKDAMGNLSAPSST